MCAAQRVRQIVDVTVANQCPGHPKQPLKLETTRCKVKSDPAAWWVAKEKVAAHSVLQEVWDATG